MTGPSLAQYTLTREELLGRAGDVIDWISTGEPKLRIEKTFPLSEAAEAHGQLEGRATTYTVLRTSPPVGARWGMEEGRERLSEPTP